jgi:hypothetical protein
VLKLFLIGFEVYNLYQAFESKRRAYIYYMSPLLVILTNTLAVIISNLERINGLHASVLLFSYWLASFITAGIRLRSEIIRFIQVFKIIFSLRPHVRLILFIIN